MDTNYFDTQYYWPYSAKSQSPN